jgi:hypothetical protein
MLDLQAVTALKLKQHRPIRQRRAPILPDSNDLARETERLEAALDRISGLAARRRDAMVAVPRELPRSVPEAVDVQALTERLDGMIARLRAAIGEDTDFTA